MMYKALFKSLSLLVVSTANAHPPKEFVLSTLRFFSEKALKICKHYRHILHRYTFTEASAEDRQLCVGDLLVLNPLRMLDGRALWKASFLELNSLQ